MKDQTDESCTCISRGRVNGSEFGKWTCHSCGGTVFNPRYKIKKSTLLMAEELYDIADPNDKSTDLRMDIIIAIDRYLTKHI